MHDSRTQGVALLIGLVLSLVGFGMAWSQGRQLATHVPIDAVIRSARVAEHEHTDDKHQISYTYSPEIEFEYVANGRTFTSRRVFTVDGSSNSFQTMAQGWVNRFPPGNRVQGYYLPRQPTSAFLVRKVAFFPYILLLVGSLVLVGSLSSANSTRMSFGSRRGGGLNIGVAWLVVAGLIVAQYLYLLMRYR